jgi:oligopeptide/dipeptide ABC transporter ATP-binding protein
MTSETLLLDVSNLRKWYEIRRGVIPRVRGHVRAVDDVSFKLRPQETLGIAGESGSGKSTIGRLVLRLIERTSGSIKFSGEDVLALDRRQLRHFRRKAQMVFQDPYGSLDPTMSVGDIIAEPLDVQGIARGSRSDRVRQLLDMVALDQSYAGRRAHELSGGQRQRVGIARALSVGPELLVADEPVSALDVSIQAQIVNLLGELKQKLRLGMLFISHDIAVMAHLSDRIATVYLGRIMEIGPARSVIERPRHPYTEALLSAVPRLDGPDRKRIVLTGDVPSASDPPSGCVFRTRCRYALPACAEGRPPMRHVGGEHHTACIRDDIFTARPAPEHLAIPENIET